MRHRLYLKHAGRCLSQGNRRLVTLGVAAANRSWGGNHMEKMPYVKPVIEVEKLEPEVLLSVGTGPTGQTGGPT